jgi:hypothetical protein
MVHQSLFSLLVHLSILNTKLFTTLEALQFTTTMQPLPEHINMYIDNQATLYIILQPCVSLSLLLIYNIIIATIILNQKHTHVYISLAYGHKPILGNKQDNITTS